MTTELEDLTASVDRLAARLEQIGPDVAEVDRRLHRLARTVLACGLAGCVVGSVLVWAVVINRQVLDTATGGTLCPVIRILTSTDPPRSTPAGRAQENRIREVTERPDYPCR